MSLPVISEDAKQVVRTAKKLIMKYGDYDIKIQAEYDVATEELKGVKTKIKEINSVFKPMKDHLNLAKKMLSDFFKPPIEELEGIERMIKGKILSYEEEKEKEYQKEQERLRKEAEKKEEKEKAKLERKAKKAEDAGDTALAEELREEKNDVFIPATIPEEQHVSASGVSARDNWIAEVVDLDALVKAVSEGKAPLSFLAPDIVNLNKQAKATKDAVKYPGVRFKNKKTLAVKT